MPAKLGPGNTELHLPVVHDFPAPFHVSGNLAPQISGKCRICQQVQHF